MKKFLISIDTEGDNLWSWKDGDRIYTENAKYLDRFQNLCNEYAFKPTYLTNYEMISDEMFKNWLKRKALANECEVGMHLHAWTTPPDVKLSNVSENPAQPYLIEYDDATMEEKICAMTSALEQGIEKKITTHRSGRWAMDERYFSLLAKYGYLVDCSVTPHVDWGTHKGETIGSRGSDYSKCPEVPYFIETAEGNIFEVPMTIRRTSSLFVKDRSLRSFAGAVKKSLKKQNIWLRPNGKNLKEMLWLIDYVSNENNTDYIMFMLHSSEFMPGGSPTFRSEESIEVLYAHLEQIFEKISHTFEGCTIGEYRTVNSITK